MIGFTDTAGFALTHLWQSVLIAAALASILILGRRMSGATRYAVAGVALTAAILTPLAAFLPESGILPAAMNAVNKAIGADRQVAPPANAPIAGAVRPDGVIQFAARLPAPALAPTQTQSRATAATQVPQMPAVPAARTEGASASLVAPIAPAIAVAPVQPVAPNTIAPTPAAAEPAFRWPTITLPEIRLPAMPDMTLPLLGLWALGALFLMGRTLMDLIAVERLAERAKPIKLTGDVRRRMGGVRVAVSAEAPGPMAAGLIRPMVILPESAVAMLDAPEMAALMEHERAHIRRLDLWAALAQRVALALFWWSPAMHWVSRRIDEERELACDEAAVIHTGDAKAFARTLTTQAESHVWARAPRLAAGAMGPRSFFGRRIRRLIEMSKLGKVPANYSGRLAFAALSFTLLAAVVVTPRIVAQTPKAQPSPKVQSKDPPAPSPRPSAAASPDARPDLDGKPHARARIIVNGTDLSPEFEAKLHEALAGLDEKIAAALAAAGVDDPDVDLDVDVHSRNSGRAAGLKGMQAGLAAQEEVMRRLPEIMDQVRESLKEQGIDWNADGKAFMIDGKKLKMDGGSFKLSPEQRAEIDAAMAQARVQVEIARADVEAHRAERDKAMREARENYGPEFQARIRAQIAESMETAEAARRAGIDAAIVSIEAELRKDNLQPEERRGLERAIASLRAGRGRVIPQLNIRLDGGRPDNRDPKASLDRQLYDAARRCEVADAGRLIDAKADVNHVFLGDGTPLIVAAKHGCVSVVNLLLERGADPNKSVPGDGNPLIIAAKHGEYAVARSLVDHRADVNAYVPGDETPLINAADGCELAIVRLLVERGADVNLAYRVDGKVRSPLGMAENNDCGEVSAYLRSKGARIDPKPRN